MIGVGLTVVASGTWFAAQSRAQAPAPASTQAADKNSQDKTSSDKATPDKATPDKNSIAGGWTLNKDLSDQPPSRGDGSDREGGGQGQGQGRSGGGYGGHRGRGGYGGGMGRGGGSAAPVDPEAQARVRDAIRDILNPADHLTIVQTDSMVVITEPDGRTTRLSPDGKKVKDDNTKIERKTRWDSGKLVSEISGAGSGKITQTFAVNTEHHQLVVTAQVDGGKNNQARTVKHIYDPDAPQ